MDNNIIKIDEENLKNDLKGVIRKTIEETLNTMLDEEAAELCNAERHERTDERRNYRSGHYHRKLLTSAGEVDLSVPKLRLAPFETAIIERYRRRESSVEESLIEMYLARGIRPPRGRLYGTPVGFAGKRLDRQQPKPEGVWQDRGLEKPAHRRGIPLCLR